MPEPLKMPDFDAAMRRLREHHSSIVERQRADAPDPMPDVHRLFVDPSFLFSADAIEWLEEDEGAVQGIVVSSVFHEWLTREGPNADVAVFVATDDQDAFFERRNRLTELLSDVAVFSHTDVQLPDEAEEVKLALLEGDTVASHILADEWTYLVANSWAVAKLRHALDAFRDAGAVVIEYGRRVGELLIEEVVPGADIPDVLTHKFLARVAAKWVVLGGASVAGDVLVPLGPLSHLATHFAVSRILQAIDP